MDEQGCHDTTQEGPDAHSPKHAEGCEPTVQRCLRVLLAIPCMSGASLLYLLREPMVSVHMHVP